MRARSSTAGLIAAIALSLPAGTAPHFTLESAGAVRLAISGMEARVGLMSEPLNARPVLEISLGATTGDAALMLVTYADEPLRPGRYAVASELPRDPSAGRRFHPCLVAGTVERPVGVFHGQTGWVTITAVENGRITGEYEMRARGFLASDLDEENQWVTIRGTFDAAGDSGAMHALTASPATE